MITRQIAQGIAPESRVVYVDNDPLVLVHARALLVNTTPEGVTTYVDGDYHEPELIVSDARNVLDFTKPIAVMFMGVLGYVEDFAEMRSIISRVMDELPPGSYLVLWDGTDTGEAVNEGSEKLAESGAVPYHLRTLGQMAECFEGMGLVEPGLDPITHWRLDKDVEIDQIDAHGAVARKP